MTEGRRQLLAVLRRMRRRELAARCRVDLSRVSRWASGHYRPGPVSQKMLAEHCGVPGPWTENVNRISP